MRVIATAITLTTDPGRKAKLERKREEYANRIAGKDPVNKPSVRSYLKLRVLSELLEKGTVDTLEFSQLLREELRDPPEGEVVKRYNAIYYESAIGIVNSYNAGTHKDDTFRGTGLT